MTNVCNAIVKALETGGKGKSVCLYGNKETPEKIINEVKENIGERVQVEVKPIGEHATAVVFTTTE